MILLVAMSVTCDLHVTYTYIFLIPFLSFWFVYLFASKSDAIPISVKLKRFHWTFGSNNLSRITYDRRGPVTTFHNSVYNVLHNDVGSWHTQQWRRLAHWYLAGRSASLVRFLHGNDITILLVATNNGSGPFVGFTCE